MDYSNEKIIESISEEIHEMWMTWAKEIMTTEPTISNERQIRWKTECFKPYQELSTKMKDLDRQFAYKIIEKLNSLNHQNLKI